MPPSSRLTRLFNSSFLRSLPSSTFKMQFPALLALLTSSLASSALAYNLNECDTGQKAVSYHTCQYIENCGYKSAYEAQSYCTRAGLGPFQHSRTTTGSNVSRLVFIFTKKAR